MGSWNITIRGAGVHHNRGGCDGKDANRMAAKFVQDLKAAGHSVVAASITSGAEDDLKDADGYLATCEANDQAAAEREKAEREKAATP